jgi:hypothetical protein
VGNVVDVRRGEYRASRLVGDDLVGLGVHPGGMTIALEETTYSTTPAAPTTRPRAAARPPKAPARRLPRRVHQAVLTAHVLTAVGWFGLAVTVAFCAFVGSSTDDLAFYEVIEATLSLSVPLGLAAATTGVVLSVTTRWGLVRYWWVVLKEAITIACIVTDVLVVGPEMSRAIETGVAGEIPGPIYAHCIVLAIATVLSVVKPKARTPLG